MSENYFPVQSIGNNLQTNYNPDVVLNNVPGKIISKGHLPTQSIDDNLQTNYYDHAPTTIVLGNVSEQGIDKNNQTNYESDTVLNNAPKEVMTLNYFPLESIDDNPQNNFSVSNPTPTRVILGNVSAQDIDKNSQTNYESNIVLNNVPNVVMPKNYFPVESNYNYPQTNYNPDVVLNNVPRKVMSKGYFPTQSIDINPQKNNYVPNIVSSYVPSKVMSKGHFLSQSIGDILQTNYYDSNYAPTRVMLGNVSALGIDNNPQANYDPNVVFNSIPNEVIYKRNFPAHNISNTFQTYYYSNSALTYVPGKEVSVSDNGENKCRQACSMAIGQNSALGNYYSHVKVTKVSATKDIGFNTQSQNGLLQKNSKASVLSDTDDRDVQSLMNLDLLDWQLPGISVSENSNFNIQDMLQEYLENTDLSNYSFESMFEEKDMAQEYLENAVWSSYSSDSILERNDKNEDDRVLSINSSVVLPATSNAQQVDDVENQTRAIVEKQASKKRNSQAVLNNISDSTEVSNEIPLGNQDQGEKNESGENKSFPHIDANASKQTETTSKQSYVRAKKNNSKSRKEYIVATVNQFAGVNRTPSDAISQPSISRENRNKFTNKFPRTNTSYKKRKFRKYRFKHPISPFSRRCNVWKCNKMNKKIQRTFFNKFMRMEIEHMMMREKLWNFYRMVMAQIGKSIRKTMYKILSAFIRKAGALIQRKKWSCFKIN